jgi:rhodanese-related sulfurtransferase
MTETTRTLSEMVLVLASGLGLGLAVNAASSDGLDLQRDYFPTAAPEVAVAEASPPAEHPEDAPTVDSPLDPAVLERLAAKGLSAVTFAETRALYEDPMYAYEAYVFIDARDDDHYGIGHIPGAHQFDHFRAERFQETMMQIIPTAMNIVVYCNGGDCEDSESAALFLLGLGADPGHLAVFTGGITEWKSRGMPVERGARNSGDLLEDGDKP